MSVFSDITFATLNMSEGKGTDPDDEEDEMMGRYAEMMMERQDSFRALLEEICELCGLAPDLSAGTLRRYAAGYSCTADEFWNMDFSEHPMKALAYAAGKVLAEMKPQEPRPVAVKSAAMNGNGTEGQLAMDFSA